MGKKLLGPIFLTVLFLLGCGLQTAGLSGKRSGLPEMGVHVDLYKPPGTSPAVSRSQLQTEVETRLRQAGVNIVPYQPTKLQPAMPLIYVNVKIAKIEDMYAYNVDILCMGKTASRGPALPAKLANCNLGTSGLVAELGQMREKVADLVNLFIKDYLSGQTGNPDSCSG
jgi:hypothetical protein